MKLALFFLFFGLLVSVAALDCNQAKDVQMCLEVQNSNLSASEKNYLQSNLLSDKKYYPDHELVKSWNYKIDPKAVPENAAILNKGVIQKAWVEILAVMPSVLYNDTLLISKNGELLTSYNYEINLPSGTTSGDCQTERSISENNGEVKIYFDNNYLGKEYLVSYVSTLNNNQAVEVLATYNIKVVTKIVHYKLKKSCKYCGYTCKYDSTEYQTDELFLQDKINAKIHNPPLWAEFKIKDQYLNTVKANLNSGEFSTLNLKFNGSYYNQHNFVFSPFLGSALVLKAEDWNDEEISNIVISEGKIHVKNVDGCSITISDFFKKKTLACDLSFTSVNFSASTDKKVYAPNEKIKLSIQPAGNNYVVKYGTKTYTTTGTLELEAEYPANKISITNKEHTEDYFIHVENDKPLSMFFSLALFGTFNYALIGLVRKFWGIVV